ncbi:hypothetical protein HPB48_015747 [Haemaphysalis longicornis]|uniref:Uncharacterized protein n=1 Tax=Haemaphysalis longicornis TaxID=44386 RepID=A0A9J6H3U5_HAELO|nr:hypothetical protein HPB48_015747 [Haemaphysalis longicornis]
MRSQSSEFRWQRLATAPLVSASTPMPHRGKQRNYKAERAESPAPIPAYFGVSSAERQRLNSLQDPNERRLYLDELGDKRGILTLGPDECVRYCEPCRRIKPDRCHHCTRCKKYVYGFNCCVPTSSASSRAHALLKISEIR